MKKIFVTMIFCSLGTLLLAQTNKNVEISTQVINCFQKNEYSKIVELFDQTMKTALPAEKLKLVWDDLNNKCGKFQKMSDITVDKIQNYDITYVLCHFEKVNLKMKTAFNDKHEIAGLFFIPENQK